VYKGQTVFSQIMDLLPIKNFCRCVDRYNGNYRVRSFTCFDQFLFMAFAQLTYRESLRDIEGGGPQKLDNVLSSESVQNRKELTNGQKTEKVQFRV